MFLTLISRREEQKSNALFFVMQNVTIQCKIECVEEGHLSQRLYGGGLLHGISLLEGRPEMSLKE